MVKPVNIDFTKVKDGGNFSKLHMPAGGYLARVTKVEDAKSKSDDSAMWLFTVKLEKKATATYPYYCKLTENQLWKLRNLMIAAGVNVPKKRLAVDPSKIVGKLIAVELEDTEYNDRIQSEITSIFPPADLDAEGPESADEGDEEEEEDADLGDGDDDEDDGESEDDDEEEESDSDDEDDEEEDEEEEPAPVKKKKAKKKPEPAPVKKSKKKKKKASTSSVDDDELEELDVDEL